MNQCTNRSYRQCSGNYLYWYDSCGSRQDVSQYCASGCYGNTCQNNYNYNYNYGYNYGNCTFHAYRLCIGNNIYWYDSCGTQQDLYQTCAGINQTCQYGQCVYQQPAPTPTYIAHYKTSCYGNDLYWYDSNSARNSPYKSCTDSNSCTVDTCASGKCSNETKCDGSTCATNSADYQKYCATNIPQCGNGTCEATLGETAETCPADCQSNQLNAISISFFAKQDATSTQWQKSVQIGENGQAYFMIAVANNGTDPVDNVTISANIPIEIISLGNVQVNGNPISGDIVTGINIGSLAATTAKTITFEGTTQAFSTSDTKQATASIRIGNQNQSDSLDITFTPGEVAGASSSDTTASAFWNFLKRWYLWILVGIVLIFLFIVVFRRLSTNA